MNQQTADVVIIGGGIVGASIAYHLTHEGCRNVVILERECLPGLGSTGRATGGVRAQFSTPISIQMSRYSLEFFRSFKEATGVDPCYRPNGYLFLATNESEMQALQRLVTFQQEQGVPEVTLVSRDDIQRMVPLLFTDDVRGGTYCPLDGFIEPMNLLQGFMSKALERGVTLMTETEVTRLLIEKGAINGVVTNRGTIQTRCVVNASGAWAKRVAAMAGFDLPVEPLRRHVAGTMPLPQLADETPMVIEAGSSFHFRKDHSGGGGALLLWNDPDEPHGENLSFDAAWLKQMLHLAYRRLPCLKDTLISPRRCWAGLYEMTPDHHPILGKCPDVEGLYLANGFSGHGVMHSPATGRAMSELILNGASSTLDISALRPERFDEGEPISGSALL